MHLIQQSCGDITYLACQTYILHYLRMAPHEFNKANWRFCLLGDPISSAEDASLNPNLLTDRFWSLISFAEKLSFIFTYTLSNMIFSHQNIVLCHIFLWSPHKTRTAVPVRESCIIQTFVTLAQFAPMLHYPCMLYILQRTCISSSPGQLQNKLHAKQR